MLVNFFKILKTPGLRKRIFIIAGLLVVFRLFAAIPIPGIDHARLVDLIANTPGLGYMNIVSGGALEKLSIAMLGVGPYITATIILQLLTMIFPRLKEYYYEEGAEGRAKFERLGRTLTVPLAVLSGFGFLRFLASRGVMPGMTISGILINVLIITAGSMLVLWLGELIGEQKLGNGVSFIIFAGIVSGLPVSAFGVLNKLSQGEMRIDTLLIFALLALVVIAGVAIINAAERKIPVSYAKRVRGNRMYGGVSTYLPIRLNQAGVIPIIFAISLLIFPQLLSQIVSAFSLPLSQSINNFAQSFQANHLAYGAAYFILVFIFTYFYTSIVFNPEEISKNLQRAGGFVAGIRPGQPTAQYLSHVINRITLFGALFLGLIAVLPIITQAITNQPNLTVGGTALLIVVSVALETAQKIDSELKIREYEV
jgi:preprotein translocase subunit SecY